MEEASPRYAADYRGLPSTEGRERLVQFQSEEMGWRPSRKTITEVRRRGTRGAQSRVVRSNRSISM